MTYCTEEDLVVRFSSVELIQLTDRTHSGNINSSVIARAIVDATAEIDGYLQGRYGLPLDNVPDVLVAYACDIARFRLYDDRVTEHVTARYDEAIAWLGMVAKGRVSLGIDTAGAPVPVSGGPASTSNQRVFDRNTLKDFL